MQRFYFGEFSAEIDDSRSHGLYRGREPIGLSDVPRKVLFILLQHRPRPVRAKTLLNQLWHPGANSSNVAKQVRSLRVVMGDERSGRYVRTLKKEGYAFVMPVTEAHAETSAEQHRLECLAVEVRALEYFTAGSGLGPPPDRPPPPVRSKSAYSWMR